MNYLDESKICLGDMVCLNSDELGQVVGLLDEKVFLENVDIEAWEVLNKGVLVKSEKYGLMHYRSLEDNDMLLVSREDC